MGFAFMVAAFVFVLGAAIGGIVATMKFVPPILGLSVFSISFFFFAYVGMFLALIGPNWLGLRFLDIVIAMCSFLFIIALFRSYHPTCGYRPRVSPVGFIAAILFFLMGVQWGTAGFGTFFTLGMAILFTGSVFLGVLLYNTILGWLRNVYIAAFLPLISFLFIAVLKLI